MAMKFDGKTLAIIAGVVLIFMFMQGQTQAVTTDDVLDSLKETALTILDNLASNPTLLLVIVGLVVALVILNKK